MCNVSPVLLQGWQCPLCRRVNAPFVTQCPCHLGDVRAVPYPVNPYPVPDDWTWSDPYPLVTCEEK